MVRNVLTFKARKEGQVIVDLDGNVHIKCSIMGKLFDVVNSRISNPINSIKGDDNGATQELSLAAVFSAEIPNWVKGQCHLI